MGRQVGGISRAQSVACICDKRAPASPACQCLRARPRRYCSAAPTHLHQALERAPRLNVLALPEPPHLREIGLVFGSQGDRKQ